MAAQGALRPGQCECGGTGQALRQGDRGGESEQEATVSEGLNQLTNYELNQWCSSQILYSFESLGTDVDVNLSVSDSA